MNVCVLGLTFSFTFPKTPSLIKPFKHVSTAKSQLNHSG